MSRLILIADDSPTIQRKAQKILQGEGFEVETVSNGVAAIKKLPTLQPVLVLADVSMPGKDGYEVCDFVKTSADLVHVPVLLVGSDLEPYDEQRGAQVRADGIIKKPFTPQDLIAMVSKFIAHGRAPVSPSSLAGTHVASSPGELAEVPPMGRGVEPFAASQEQDLAAVPAGSTFAGQPLDEMPATPPEPVPQASPQSLVEPQLGAAPEDVLGGSPESLLAPAEPFPDFALGPMPELTAEPMPEAAPEPLWVSPELISESAPESMPEPSQDVTEPIAEPMPEAPPEPLWVSPELISESAPESMPEPSQDVTEPTAEPMPEASPEPIWVCPELISESAPESMPEPSLVVAEPSAEPMPEATPVQVWVSPEMISETAPETTPEPSPVVAEPSAEPTPEAAPEAAWVSPELISETTREATSEQRSVVPEPVAESGSPFTWESVTETAHLPAEAAPEAPPAAPLEEGSPLTEPIMEEEQMEPIHPLAPVPDYLTPEVDRTVAASVPPEIAEPRLISELAPALHAPEEHPMVEGQPREPKTATHLDSFSLGEAVEGQAFVSPPETAAGLAPEAEVTQPRATAAGAPSVIDPEWVHVVVQRVVAKMAPSVLSPQLVEDLVRILTEEITADLAGPSPNREKV